VRPLVLHACHGRVRGGVPINVTQARGRRLNNQEGWGSADQMWTECEVCSWSSQLSKHTANLRTPEP
jgi:hypothetical protein